MTVTDRLPAEPGPDAFVFGNPPRPPRRPPRRKGEQELAVAGYLKTLPDSLRKGPLAVSLLILARRIDQAQATGMTDRDAKGLHQELRQTVSDLTAMAPGERKGDGTDEVRARRERRLTVTAGQPA